jgi:hypothetical protein
MTNEVKHTEPDYYLWSQQRITALERQLAELKKLQPFDEIDDVSGFHCACIYSKHTAERIQRCLSHEQLERQNRELRESMRAASNWIKNCSTPLDAAHELDKALGQGE